MLRILAPAMAVALLFAGAAPARAQTASEVAYPAASTELEQRVPEYAVKSALLYNLAKYTRWPEALAADTTAPFRLCVLGEDPFREHLDALVGKAINGRETIAIRLKNFQHATGCDLVFISGSESHNLAAVLMYLHDKAILTIGDSQDFASLGGIIELKLVKSKIRFELNIDSAKQAGLAFRPELYAVAIVRSGNQARNGPTTD